MIEITVSILIVAMTSIAVFSVILASASSQKKGDNKETAAMLLKQAQQTLQIYVSAVPGDANYSPNAGGWWQADSLCPAWALSAGRHDISSLMPAGLRTDPAVPCAWGTSCYFVYTVANLDCLNQPLGVTNTDSKSCKNVIFDMKYAD